MENQHNKLDKLFAQKLEQHSTKPRPEAWQKLQSKLTTEQKGAAILPWTRLSLAASILMLFAIGLPFYMKTKPKPKAKMPLAQIQQPAPRQVAKVNNVPPKAPIPQILYSANIARSAQRERVAKQTQYTKVPAEQIITTGPTIAVNITETNLAQVSSTAAVDAHTSVASNNAAQPSKGETTQIDNELTVVFTLADYSTIKALDEKTENMEPNKKDKYINKLFRQLRNAKNGAKVDWQEVGFKPAKILARAESKIRNTENEVKESYYTTKDKTIF